jgi:hypothetical protein
MVDGLVELKRCAAGPKPGPFSKTARISTLNRNDAVKELNFDRINRIYRMEKRL